MTKTIPKEQVRGSLSTKKPEAKKCKECGKLVEPEVNFLLKKWLSPDVCDKCDREKLTREKEAIIKKALDIKKARIEKHFSQSRLSKRFMRRTFDNFKLDNKNKKAYETCVSYANDFSDKMKNGEGLLLVGDFGTGKTHLAAAILQEVISQDHTGVFISIPDLITKIRNTWDTEENEWDLITALTEADLVVLDDIGAENTKDWVRERLFVIINSRYEKMLPTIFTTNCSVKDLKNKLGGRIESRINEMCKGVMLVGEDYRKNN